MVVQFHVIIADESHYLKNADAQRTKAILPLLQSANRAVLLTGTPALSRPAELYPQLACVESAVACVGSVANRRVTSAIGRGVFKAFKPFGFRYCNGHRVSCPSLGTHVCSAVDIADDSCRVTTDWTSLALRI